MRRLALVFCFVAFTGAIRGQTVAPKPEPPQTAEQARAFKQFTELVRQYVDLRNKVEASLPRLGNKEQQEKIVERQREFAQKIREARPGAERGDIFAPEIAEEFRHLIRREFRGPKGPNARKTIREGEPLKPFRLRVNDTYPEMLPATSFPPTLLLKLPQLPKEVAYRIVGRALVLQDVEANLIVDFVHEALP